MKTLLVIAQHPALPEAIRAGLSPEKYRLIHRLALEEAEPLLAPGVIDICIFDAEFTGVQGIWAIEKIRRRVPSCPVVVYTDAKPWEWEEEAYLRGVAHVLIKPVRPRLLENVLQRFEAPAAVPPSRSTVAFPPHPPEVARPIDPSHPVCKALEVFRDFSAILTHSLKAEALLRQFLLLLREIIGVNRAAVFLRRPTLAFGGAPATEEPQRLHSACAIGLSPGLLEHFQLSFENGIGGFLYHHSRILRRDSPEAQDPEMQKEFELLGAQVAVPMLDRETLVGAAVFDGRITGEPLANNELELIFHLLEQLGLAVKNIWLHGQLVSNHEMLADILQQLSNACVVISRELNIVHANKAARQLFTQAGRRGAELDFCNLPQALGSKVYLVLKTGTGVAPFKYQPPDAPERVYQVSIVPFQRDDAELPNSALLVAEDRTQSEQLQRLELEAANLRLIKAMAERLAHEIGNALVPLATHQQLLADKYQDAEFRLSLETALADGVKRVSRLTNQMRFLARDVVGSQDAFPLGPLVEEAFHEAQKHQPVKTSKLNYEDGGLPLLISGDRAALKHALAEVLLNAIQANPADAVVGVQTRAAASGNGVSQIEIEVQDNGAGFSPETAKKVPEPFFTTRNVGLGLGLSVSRKIIETHHGKLTVVSPQIGQHGLVRISLPAASSAKATA